MSAELERIREMGKDPGAAWRRFGPYVSERAWGTVREDYSADGDAWGYFPHDHARSRAYRWNEDGLAGYCDDRQHLCLGLALWNEQDSILKERMFGVTNAEGNHGEDVKEYFFYLDNLPSHAYARFLYKYPQVEFPYEQLVAGNAARNSHDPEYELYDAIGQAFREQRYFDVFVEYAKADPEDILCRIRVINRGPDAAPIHVLPQLWYRNTWSWRPGSTRPVIEAAGKGAARTAHAALGERWWYAQSPDPGAEPHELLFTENETNFERLYGSPNPAPCVKDGIHDAIVRGLPDKVSLQSGSKAAAHFERIVPPGGTFTVQVRFAPRALTRPFARFDAVLAQRLAEADEFYAELHGPGLSEDEKLVQRQAYAGLLWSKQFYHYEVDAWLRGDPGQPPPPPERHAGRNHEWWHFAAADILLMPDKWEYPWFASWDLAFHCVVMAELDPAFAKHQLMLLTLPRLQHPHGTVPSYEWNFGAVNPPVLAWAAWQVYLTEKRKTGQGDLDFLGSLFEPLLLMLSWWVNRKDSEGKGLFGGGFLGLDNIGVFDRDQPLPTGGQLEQSDATGWMAMLQINMMEIGLELALHDRRYEAMVNRFGQHFIVIANALKRMAGVGGLWSEEQGFYFDAIRMAGSDHFPLEIYSIAGLVPVFAARVVDQRHLDRFPGLRETVYQVLGRMPHLNELIVTWLTPGRNDTRLLSLADGEQLARMLRRVLDENQFLSPYGVRSLSRLHREQPYRFRVDGHAFEIAYAPGDSDNRSFGGNSNWRGPVWFPINYLLIQALEAYACYYGDGLKVENPVGSGNLQTFDEVAGSLARRLTGIFVRDPSGRRAVLGTNEYFQQDPHWRDCIPFHEYFHGDTGAGLGASHQTGWTALVALLLARRTGAPA